MAKGGNHKQYSEEWFLSRGYTKNSDGSYQPPKFVNPLTKLNIQPGKYKDNGSPSLIPNEFTLSVTEEMFEYKTRPNKQIDLGDTQINIKGNLLMVFDVEPVGKPRMTQSDKWKNDITHPDPKRRQRKPVHNYFKFKDKVIEQSLAANFKLPESNFRVVFIIPMSHSWSDKKKSLMNNTPHQQKPDADNMIKALKDSLCKDDSVIWDYRITKYWGKSGKILIYKIED